MFHIIYDKFNNRITGSTELHLYIHLIGSHQPTINSLITEITSYRRVLYRGFTVDAQNKIDNFNHYHLRMRYL